MGWYLDYLEEKDKRARLEKEKNKSDEHEITRIKNEGKTVGMQICICVVCLTRFEVNKKKLA